MTDRKISVIVPVYNSGPFLLETLDSLACQSFRDYEVILVDDGSTDESPRIIDDVCARSKRFRALHTKNGGAYKARLLGVREAKGEYIAFCGVNMAVTWLFLVCDAAPLVVLALLSVFLPTLASTVRRLRDTDISPWLIFAFPVLPFLLLVPSVTSDELPPNTDELAPNTKENE